MTQENHESAGSAGSSGSSWRDSLPADLKSHPTLERFTDVASLAKEHVNVQSLIGKKGILPPKEGDDTDRRRFYKDLGCPDSPDGYSDPKVQIPERLAPFFQTEKLAAMKKKAHELGISKEQFEKLSEDYIASQVAEIGSLVEQSETELKAGELALRKKWGMAYDQNKTLAVKVAEAYASDDAEREFLSLHGNNPALISMLSKIGRDVSEDTIARTRSNQGIRMMTPDQAMAEANRLMSSEAFLKGTHPDNASVKQRVNDLFKMARG